MFLFGKKRKKSKQELILVEESKIKQIYIYDKAGTLLTISKSFEFTLYGETVEGDNLVYMKCIKTNKLCAGMPIKVVFIYKDFSRFECTTAVECTDGSSLEFYTRPAEQLQERRASFKLEVCVDAEVTTRIVEGNELGYPEPIKSTIININLGGILLETEKELQVGECYIIKADLDGELFLKLKVLRQQCDLQGKLIGYGCQFFDVTEADESHIAMFIFDNQILRTAFNTT